MSLSVLAALSPSAAIQGAPAGSVHRIEAYPAHFSGPRQALEEIGRLEWWPVTAVYGPVAAGPLHAYHHDIVIYVTTGSLIVVGKRGMNELEALAGDKLYIPAGCAHTIQVPQYLIAITAFPDAESAAASETPLAGPETGAPARPHNRV